jgi:hypothetical protein
MSMKPEGGKAFNTKSMDKGTRARVTISGGFEKEWEEDGVSKTKKCLSFDGTDKYLQLNVGNANAVSHLSGGSWDVDDWRGLTIVLWHDPTVMFGDKVVGGVKVLDKDGKNPFAVPDKPIEDVSVSEAPVYASAEDDDDIPF